MLIAGALAAEQRAIVAHSASYGFGRPRISKAPAGAAENKFDFTRNLSPHPGLEHIFVDAFPRLSPWATTARHSVTDTNQLARHL